MASNDKGSNDIVHLNVGGTRFSTSRHTLLWNQHSFFTSLLNGRIPTLRDENGAIFIDRDPQLFSVILNYLRTRDLHFGSGVDITAIRHEAEYYGLFSLVQKLTMCEDYYHGPCGDLLFHGYVDPPTFEEEEVEESQNSLEKACADFIKNGGKLNPTASSPSTQSFFGGQSMNERKINLMRGHYNWLATTFAHSVCLYQLKDAIGWQLIWRLPKITERVCLLALNAKAFAPAGLENGNQMVAFTTADHAVHLWSVQESGRAAREIGQFSLLPGGQNAASAAVQDALPIDDLLFVGCQLVALSRQAGRVGIWHGMTQQWQSQEVVPITSYDVAATEFLVLGCANGCIYYIDMQKFPLRMKDNDLLVTELFKDPKNDAVTALSVYVTPKTSMSGGNWIEIAYGTSSGCIRIIVQHPETVCQGPVMFQSFSVHRSEVVRVVLSERHLVSVCSQDQHVRTWSTTRFRGMISTQPGSTPLASFHLMSVASDGVNETNPQGNDPGPYGDRDDQLVFVQKVMPVTDQLLVRFAAQGKRVCKIQSVNGSPITSFLVHECEGTSRMASRSRRYLFTGHADGAIQVWDLTTALECIPKVPKDQILASTGAHATHITTSSRSGGPTPREMLRLLETCEIGPASFRANTPSMVSPSASSYWRAPTSNDSTSEDETPNLFDRSHQFVDRA